MAKEFRVCFILCTEVLCLKSLRYTSFTLSDWTFEWFPLDWKRKHIFFVSSCNIQAQCVWPTFAPDRGAVGFGHLVLLLLLLQQILRDSALFQIIYNIKRGSVCAGSAGVQLSAEEVCQRIFQEVDVNSDGAATTEGSSINIWSLSLTDSEVHRSDHPGRVHQRSAEEWVGAELPAAGHQPQWLDQEVPVWQEAHRWQHLLSPGSSFSVPPCSDWLTDCAAARHHFSQCESFGGQLAWCCLYTTIKLWAFVPQTEGEIYQCLSKCDHEPAPLIHVLLIAITVAESPQGICWFFLYCFVVVVFSKGYVNEEVGLLVHFSKSGGQQNNTYNKSGSY